MKLNLIHYSENCNFENIKIKKLKSPFKPTVTDDDITYIFDEEYNSMTTDECPVADWISDYQEWFNNFYKDHEDNDSE